MLLTGAIPARVAVGLRVNTGMVTFGKALGTTITNRFTTGISGSDNGKSEEEIFSFQSDSNHIILNAKRVRISHKLKDNLKGDFKWLIS